MSNVSLSAAATPRLEEVRTARFAAGQRWAAYGACLVLSIAWTVIAGKDVPWDALHHHLYAGFSALNDRLAVDFFPAGPQTYMSPPYSHVPLYLMVRAEWPSLAIGIALACLHCATLWMTWELAAAVSRRSDGTSPAVVTWSAVAAALANPVLLQVLGSSFNDITTGMLALAGYVALANAFLGGRIGLVAVGGLLLGTSAALKLSNAFFALLPALPMVLGTMPSARSRAKALMVFSVCAGVAVLAVAGPWAWRLQQTFGNPVFPMFNEAFHPTPPQVDSPQAARLPAPPQDSLGFRIINNIRDPRFAPPTVAEALARPFEMLQARRMVHTEPMAADVRYAALLVVALVAAVGLARRRSLGPTVTDTPSGQPLAWLAASFGLAWAIWMTISGNSRYFIPMACIAGVVLVAGLHRTLGHMPRLFGWSLAGLLGFQGVLMVHAVELRWNPLPWDGPWMQVTVPERLKSEAFTYLSMDSQSQSFLLPHLAPGSSFIGMGGGIDSPPDTFAGRRSRMLIDARPSHVRALKLVQVIASDGSPVPPAASTYDFPLRRLGLRVDTRDCEVISYKGNAHAIEREGPRSGPRGVVYIHSCRVVPGPGLTEAELARKRMADRVLDHVSAACPELFPPRPGSSWLSGQIWRRNYGDLVLWLNDEGWVRFADMIRGRGDFVSLGRQEDWIEAPQKLTCTRTGGRVHVERLSN